MTPPPAQCHSEGGWKEACPEPGDSRCRRGTGGEPEESGLSVTGAVLPASERSCAHCAQAEQRVGATTHRTECGKCPPPICLSLSPLSNLSEPPATVA